MKLYLNIIINKQNTCYNICDIFFEMKHIIFNSPQAVEGPLRDCKLDSMERSKPWPTLVSSKMSQ